MQKKKKNEYLSIMTRSVLCFTTTNNFMLMLTISWFKNNNKNKKIKVSHFIALLNGILPNKTSVYKHIKIVDIVHFHLGFHIFFFVIFSVLYLYYM